MAQGVKNPPASAGDTGDAGSYPGREDPLGEEMATHSSIPAWRSPWTEVGCSPWGRTESDTSEQSDHTHTHTFLCSRLKLFFLEIISGVNSYFKVIKNITLEIFRLQSCGASMQIKHYTELKCSLTLGKLTLEGSPGNHLVPSEYVVIPSCNISDAWTKLICFTWMCSLFPRKFLLTSMIKK